MCVYEFKNNTGERNNGRKDERRSSSYIYI